MHSDLDENERLGQIVPFLATLSIGRIEASSLHGEYNEDLQMMVSINDGSVTPLIESQRDDVYFLTKTKVDMESDDDDSEMINACRSALGGKFRPTAPLFLDLITKTMAYTEEDDETKSILDE